LVEIKKNKKKKKKLPSTLKMARRDLVKVLVESLFKSSIARVFVCLGGIEERVIESAPTTAAAQTFLFSIIV
jgi:hypothetical protein